MTKAANIFHIVVSLNIVFSSSDTIDKMLLNVSVRYQGREIRTIGRNVISVVYMYFENW